MIRSALICTATAMIASTGAATEPAPAATDEAIRITRVGTTPSARGPSQNFTGAVRVDMFHQAAAPWRASSASVTFEPGARTVWHSHPVGQTLIVTAGAGRVQRWGGSVETIHPGDVVWIPAGAKHWHGAAPTTGMSHIAITETLDGRNVEWMEPVSNEQYTR